MKKVLAVLVNYGTEQLDYLTQVVRELKSFVKYEVTVVVNSNIELNIEGVDKVNVIKLKNYQLLPMTCRETIWENRELYDIFIYNENDHLFKEYHIDKFLEYTKLLPKNMIAGLIQYEENDKGEIFYPAYHSNYTWEIDSVKKYASKIFAHFTNLHQACFILTKEQVLRIGKVNDFTKFMGNSHYSFKCKTNTDIYQFCGMTKVICISEFYLNLIHHLPNIYINGGEGRRQLGKYDDKMQSKLKELYYEYN